MYEDPHDSEPAPGQDDWPQTVEAAVDGLLSSLPDDGIEAIGAMDRGAAHLAPLHARPVGAQRLRGCGEGNRALLDSCAAFAASHELHALWTGHPDDASSIIVEALWLRLQEPRVRRCADVVRVHQAHPYPERPRVPAR